MVDVKRTLVHEDDNGHVYADVHLLLALLISPGMEEVSTIQHRFRQQRKIQLVYHLIHGKRRLVESCQQSWNTSNHDLEIMIKTILTFN